VDELRRCPVTKVQKSRGAGSRQETWYWGAKTGDENDYGSYAMNGYFYDGGWASGQADVDNAFKDLVSVDFPSKTPVFCDGMWPDAWPKAGQRVARNLETGDNGSGMGRVSLARHNVNAKFDLSNRPSGQFGAAINIGFIDGHAASVPLEELYAQYWHATWVVSPTPPP
jgi:prepilin-type processing-associated H-X9-DG protein